MPTILAVWKNGVFKPDGLIDLADGARVEMQITAISAADHPPPDKAFPPLPDPPFDSEVCSAPFDLPMPTFGITVKAPTERLPHPESHDIAE